MANNNVYYGFCDKSGKVVDVTDLNGCYDENGKCYCAECYYYGYDHVNCSKAGDLEGSKPVKWVSDHWEVISQ